MKVPTVRRVPLWVCAIIIIVALPSLFFPFLGRLSVSTDMMIRGLTWFFPVYGVVSALLAWQCWGRRTLMSWIIIALMVLSDASFYYLATQAASLNFYR